MEDEDIKDLNKYISFSKKSENFSHNTDYEWHKELGEKIENLLSRLKTAERNIDEIKKYATQLKIYTEYEKKHCKLSRKLIRIKQGLTVEYRMHRVAHNILAIIEKNGQERR